MNQKTRKMREIGKSRKNKFIKDLIKLITSYGAVKGGQYGYVIHTMAGILNISVREPDILFSVNMKFEEPDKAVKLLKNSSLLGVLNKFSGKYNVLQSKEEYALEMTEFHLKNVTKKITIEFKDVTSLADIEIGEIVQMTSPQFGNAVNRVVKIANDFTGLNRDIAYFGFYDKMTKGVPTEKEFAKNMLANKLNAQTFAVWGFMLKNKEFKKYIS